MFAQVLERECAVLVAKQTHPLLHVTLQAKCARNNIVCLIGIVQSAGNALHLSCCRPQDRGDS